MRRIERGRVSRVCARATTGQPHCASGMSDAHKTTWHDSRVPLPWNFVLPPKSIDRSATAIDRCICSPASTLAGSIRLASSRGRSGNADGELQSSPPYVRLRILGFASELADEGTGGCARGRKLRYRNLTVRNQRLISNNRTVFKMICARKIYNCN